MYGRNTNLFNRNLTTNQTNSSSNNIFAQNQSNGNGNINTANNIFKSQSNNVVSTGKRLGTNRVANYSATDPPRCL